MFRNVLVTVLLLLFIGTASGAAGPNSTAQSLSTFESSSEAIAPPPPPDIGDGPEKFDLFLELRDIDNKSLIGDVHVVVEVDGTTGRQLNTLNYVGENGILKLKLSKDRWMIILKVDELSTSGKDYYLKSYFDLDKDTNQTLYFLPVGSVRGYVYDDSNHAITGADVKFECGADYGVTTLTKTDSFGSFTRDWMPVGLCVVFAAYGDRVGEKEVTIRHGEIKNVDINLTGSLLSSSRFSVAFALAFVLLGTLLYTYKKRGHAKVPPSTQSSPQPPEKPLILELNKRGR
ncbi:MAG: carboxypeptidase-like regulatory domain-containing protein, partial [Candidatus Hydrothermarchaeaceae archaeon]